MLIIRTANLTYYKRTDPTLGAVMTSDINDAARFACLADAFAAKVQGGEVVAVCGECGRVECECVTESDLFFAPENKTGFKAVNYE